MRTAIAICLLVAANLTAQMEQHDHAHYDERLGTVNFPISCSPAAQAKFTRAVALLHSFWYEEAERRSPRRRTSIRGAGWRLGRGDYSYHPVWPSS